jgi:hypothetical protein
MLKRKPETGTENPTHHKPHLTTLGTPPPSQAWKKCSHLSMQVTWGDVLAVGVRSAHHMGADALSKQGTMSQVLTMASTLAYTL